VHVPGSGFGVRRGHEGDHHDARRRSPTVSQFGSTGTYEKLAGTIEFALDPADPHNKAIVDLEHARKDRRKVHFTSDLFVLRAG
jgi:hypothetical protein